MPNNLLFLDPGHQNRPHPLKVKWSFPYVKSTVQITNCTYILTIHVGTYTFF